MEYIVFTVCLALLLLGIPLYIFLFAFSSYLFYVNDIPLLSTVVSFQKLQSQEFVSAIPLFTFAGYILSRSNSPKRIVKFNQACFQFIPASSSIVVIIMMALFTALTGASGVSILAMGALMFPILKESSDNEKFAHGLITSSGSIGLLFAPSIPVIIYTIIANQNASSSNQIQIDTLFLVAIIPSLLLIMSFIAYSFTQEKKREYKFDLDEIKNSVKESIWELPLPFIVYGGIYSGQFTILEAGIVTALYTFFIVFIVHRDLSLKKDFIDITVDALKLSGNIFIIMATAFILTNFIIYQGIPNKIFHFISPFLDNKYTFLFAINILLLITGCLLDIFSAILIVLPLIIPIVEKYGINPYHFAIIFLVNLEIGYITPPVGLNLFIASYRFKKNIIYLYRSAVPFLILMVLNLALLTYIPEITTYISSVKDPDSVKKNTSSAPVAPSRIDELILVGRANNQLTLKFQADHSTAHKDTKYHLYYLEEEESDLSVILDFGDLVEFHSKDLEVKDGMFQLNLEIVDENSSYSLVMIAQDTGGNESLPSDILVVE